MIAVYDFNSIKDIETKLINVGVPKEKIKVLALEPDFTNVFMDQRMSWIRDFADYCYERNISGSTVECGVFRGDSAKFINQFFYDKRLYLFDTFKGFNEKDIEDERGLGYQAYLGGVYRQKFIC